MPVRCYHVKYGGQDNLYGIGVFSFYARAAVTNLRCGDTRCMEHTSWNKNNKWSSFRQTRITDNAETGQVFGAHKETWLHNEDFSNGNEQAFSNGKTESVREKQKNMD